MPVCNVAPSGMSEATLRATRMCISVAGSASSWSNGLSVSTIADIRLSGTTVSPCVRGICRFTSAITTRAQRNAVCVQSTVVPRLTKPCASGGDTCINTTSSGSAPVSNRFSISLKNIGV